MDTTARTTSWTDLPVDHPMNGIDRRRLIGERCMISHVTLHTGFRLEPHRHAHEQIALIESGRVRFTLGEGDATRVVELGPGEILHLPPEVLHGAEALETSVVLDVFSPPSQSTGVDREA